MNDILRQCINILILSVRVFNLPSRVFLRRHLSIIRIRRNKCSNPLFEKRWVLKILRRWWIGYSLVSNFQGNSRQILWMNELFAQYILHFSIFVHYKLEFIIKIHILWNNSLLISLYGQWTMWPNLKSQEDNFLFTWF